MNNDFEGASSPQTDKMNSLFVFDKRIIWLAFKKRIILIGILTIAVMALAAIILKLNANPVWKANCYVIKAPKNMSTPVEMPYLYQTFDIYTVLETVKIREVMADVVKKLTLDITPETLFKNIEVQRGNRSSVLRFTASWANKKMAADIANAVAEAFIANSTKLMNSATQKIHDYYVRERQTRLDAISVLEEQHTQFRQQYGVISIPQETQVKFDQLKEVEIRMIANRLRTTEMESKIAEMDDKLAGVPLEKLQSWTYTRTDETRLLELQRELELLQTRYTEENPKVIKVLQDIKELKELMKNKERNLPEATTWGPSGLIDVYTIDKSRFEAEKKASIGMNREYQLKIDSLRSNLGNLTDIQKEFFELERQLQLNRDVLRIIESRLAEAKMSIQSNVSDYEIIEPATPPLFPEGTRLKIIVLAIGFLFFLFSSLCIIGIEIIDQHVKSPRDFLHGSLMTLIGNIPDENQLDDHVYSNRLQIFADRLLRIVHNNEHPFISVGSDIPETGKSFIISDIIQLLRTKHLKILYIDSIRELTNETKDFLINDWLYNGINRPNVRKDNSVEHFCYFLADDSVFKYLVDSKQIADAIRVFNDYDLVIWELFDYEYNKQLFASIASASSALVLVSRFKRSSRASLSKIKRFLIDREYTQIYGVLNYVPKAYFHDED